MTILRRDLKMSSNDDKNVGMNFLAGLGLGALLGAAAALLLAPKSGVETRQDIAGVAEDLRDKAGKMVKDLSDSSEELVKKSKDLLESTKEKVQSAVEAGKQAVVRKSHEMSGETEESEA
jgi:gas vesicle protein